MNVTVYLGANYGTDPTLQTTVAELGQWIGKNGHTLVYGGSASGLMGVLARSVMAAGGPVIGVEPQFFIDEGYELDGLTQLIVTQDMTERKAKMIELGDAFIAFPGGTGTLEEITEVMSKVSLKHLDEHRKSGPLTFVREPLCRQPVSLWGSWKNRIPLLSRYSRYI